MPKGAVNLDQKIVNYEKELKALKKRKSEIESKTILRQTNAIIRAMKKNADFANELKELCKKHDVALEPKPRKPRKK